MASLLISDLLLGKQEESIDFIKRACSIILTTSKESSKRDNRFIGDKDGRICELLDLVSKLISEQEDFECDLDELKLVLDIVCYPYLATCQDSSRENPGGIKDEKSKVFHSASRLIATLLQKSKEFDPVATVIVSGIDSAISLYLEETHAINSDLGTGEGEGNINIPEQDVAMSGEKKFSIFAALEVLDCLLATSTTPFLSKLFTTTWYQELTTNAIDILEFGEPVVCARLCSIIMRNLIPSRPILAPDVASASSLHVDSTFWAIVRRGLLHHRDPLTRKRAVFLLKRALEVATVKGESFTVFISDEERAEETKYPLLSWNPENKERLLEVWNDFFLLYEALDEVQIHVVQPVLPKLMKLQEAAIPDDTGKLFLHTSWLTLLLERSFRHESKTITRWGMEQSLRLDVSKLPLLAQNGDKFIFGALLSTLREDYLYMRSAEGVPVAQRPDTACQLEALLTGIITHLSEEGRKRLIIKLR
ncbi:putative methyltransferase TARBP1 [Apostichopus japonicus]|uniref:Putative methyltransferase TARBP1 n=1 Tax=Stichopus japonicus TaxID=307972 RepID=A0A2G8K9N9_STIJA|nr:putative methyltransferase TARBP1 [Apostichopus japonicus]